MTSNRRPVEFTHNISKTMTETADRGPPLVPPSSPDLTLEESPEISLETPDVPPVSPRDPENIRVGNFRIYCSNLLEIVLN